MDLAFPAATPAAGNDAWLKEALKYSQIWLRECDECHPKCRPAVDTTLPTRLLDLGPSQAGGKHFVHLCTCPARNKNNSEEESLFRRRWKYAALSYCWGGSPNLTTTISNLKSRTKNIPWAEIPSTIQDAITVTRRLGIRYIWVDALCIVQSPGGDWETESSRMADVYGGAFITISAALSPDVSHGLSRRSALLSDIDRALGLSGNPLYRRGWALQERMLSKRNLIFGLDQLRWTGIVYRLVRRERRVTSYRQNFNAD